LKKPLVWFGIACCIAASPAWATSPPNDRGHDRSRDAAGTSPEYFFGVWRTRIPGAVWSSPSGYRGYDWLSVRAAVNVGDLIIRPDGTYVWNSGGGKAGRWERGRGDWPIVLIDTVEKRRWMVSADRMHTGGRDIVVSDGNSSFDGRR
jgi:hypothetical protein